MIVAEADDPFEAFVRALDATHNKGEWVGPKKEIVGFVMCIGQSRESPIEKHNRLVARLDEFHGEDHYKITSDWTFPADYSTDLMGYPSPREDDGEYFTKLCTSDKGNQLQNMAEKMDKWGRNNRTVAQVFDADEDLNQMFPPCLLDIQAFYRDDGLHLHAHFRSHTIAKSYYGDLVGLTRLHQWLAGETQSKLGELIVLSGSLHYRKKNKEHLLARKLYDEFV